MVSIDAAFLIGVAMGLVAGFGWLIRAYCSRGSDHFGSSSMGE